MFTLAYYDKKRNPPVKSQKSKKREYSLRMAEVESCVWHGDIFLLKCFTFPAKFLDQVLNQRASNHGVDWVEVSTVVPINLGFEHVINRFFLFFSGVMFIRNRKPRIAKPPFDLLLGFKKSQFLGVYIVLNSSKWCYSIFSE